MSGQCLSVYMAESVVRSPQSIFIRKSRYISVEMYGDTISSIQYPVSSITST